MFTANVIGNIAAVPQVKNVNGNEFTTFRVAHNDRWTDAQGVRHDNTVWIDCIMNGRPRVLEFLQRGTMVYVTGSVSLRVYSSKKDRCMKAGAQISVRNIELLGGKTDDVPSSLYDANGVEHRVVKYFHVDVSNTQLVNRSSARFGVDANGWVTPIIEETTPDDGAVIPPAQNDTAAATSDTPSVF